MVFLGKYRIYLSNNLGYTRSNTKDRKYRFMFNPLIVLVMNTIHIVAAYLIVCTLGAGVTQFTGHSGRKFREALLVWWFFPLVFIYVFTSLVFEGAEGFAKSMKEFKDELLNTE